MGLNKILKRIESKSGYSFLGFLLAILFGTITIYTTFFKDTNPKLNYIVEANSKVLDLKENVRRLDILYNGENIKKTGKNLSLIKLTVKNQSAVNILESHFDKNDMLGFKLENSEIVETPEVVITSNDYIKRNISLNIDSTGEIRFTPIIIDGNEYFTISILALHKENQIPVVVPLGKVAGIHKLNLINDYNNSKEKTFWQIVFDGDFYSQTVKVFIYGVIFLVLLITLFFIGGTISDYFDDKKSHKIYTIYNNKIDSAINKFLQEVGFSNKTIKNFVLTWVNLQGLDYIISFYYTLTNKEELNYKVELYMLSKKYDSILYKENDIKSKTMYKKKLYFFHEDFFDRDSQGKTIFDWLFDNNLIKYENDVVVVDKGLLNDLSQFINNIKPIINEERHITDHPQIIYKHSR